MFLALLRFSDEDVYVGLWGNFELTVIITKKSRTIFFIVSLSCSSVNYFFPTADHLLPTNMKVHIMPCFWKKKIIIITNTNCIHKALIASKEHCSVRPCFHSHPCAMRQTQGCTSFMPGSSHSRAPEDACSVTAPSLLTPTSHLLGVTGNNSEQRVLNPPKSSHHCS